jgi:hypothetical protein
MKPTPDFGTMNYRFARITKQGRLCYLKQNGDEPMASFDGEHLAVYQIAWKGRRQIDLLSIIMKRYAQYRGYSKNSSLLVQNLLMEAGLTITFFLGHQRIVVDSSCAIIEPQLAKLLVYSEDSAVRNICCDIFLLYVEVISIPDNLCEQVAGKLLALRLDRAVL